MRLISDAEAPAHVIPAARRHWPASGSQSQRRSESRDPEAPLSSLLIVIQTDVGRTEWSSTHRADSLQHDIKLVTRRMCNAVVQCADKLSTVIYTLVLPSS